MIALTHCFFFKVLLVGADASTSTGTITRDSTSTTAEYSTIAHLYVRNDDGSYSEKLIVKKTVPVVYRMFWEESIEPEEIRDRGCLLDEKNIYMATYNRELYYYPHYPHYPTYSKVKISQTFIHME